MCGYSNLNWIYSLTTLVLFGALMVASVVFLVRSLNPMAKGKDHEED